VNFYVSVAWLDACHHVNAARAAISLYAALHSSENWLVIVMRKIVGGAS